MPNFLSWYFEGRDIPAEDVHIPQDRPIEYSPTSLADGPSPTGPAAEDSAPASPSVQSDASIPPPPHQHVPESSRTLDAPKEKIARTEPTTADRTEQLGVLELNVPAGARPKAVGVKRIDATSQTATLPCKAMPKHARPCPGGTLTTAPAAGKDRPAIPRRRAGQINSESSVPVKAASISATPTPAGPIPAPTAPRSTVSDSTSHVPAGSSVVPEPFSAANSEGPRNS